MLNKKLRALVVGAGVFGRNHLRVLRALELEGAPVTLAGIVETDAVRAREASRDFGAPAYASVEEVIRAASPDIALVCVPTKHHADAAEPLLHAGVPCLVEKPLAASLADAERMLRAAEAGGTLLQVGHLERFNPAVTAVRQYLTQPMFFEAHRLSIFTPRSLDVDVVLDLMIHDLDIVLSLVNSPVREIRAVGLPVLSSRVDIANVRLEFDSGCVANFTASRVSTERVRKLRFFQPHQYLSLDFARQDLLLIDVTAAAQAMNATNTGTASPDPETPDRAAAAHPSAGLSLGKIPVAPGEPLRLEIESFLAAVRSSARPLVSGEDGYAALALALQINASIAAHTTRAGL